MFIVSTPDMLMNVFDFNSSYFIASTNAVCEDKLRHQVSLLRVAKIKLYSLDSCQPRQQQTHAHTSHTRVLTHMHSHAYPYVKLVKWLLLLHMIHYTHFFKSVAVISWSQTAVSSRWSNITSVSIILSPMYEKCWCVQTCGCEEACAALPHLESWARSSQLEERWGMSLLPWSSGWMEKGFPRESVSTVCCHPAKFEPHRENECVSEYFWHCLESQL